MSGGEIVRGVVSLEINVLVVVLLVMFTLQLL